jgi:hypothetical protein
VLLLRLQWTFPLHAHHMLHTCQAQVPSLAWRFAEDAPVEVKDLRKSRALRKAALVYVQTITRIFMVFSQNTQNMFARNFSCKIVARQKNLTISRFVIVC